MYVGHSPDFGLRILLKSIPVSERRGEATDVFIDDTASLRYLPPVYYHLGRAQEAVSGSVTAGARASYESFLKARDAADPPDLLAADARRRLGR